MRGVKPWAFAKSTTSRASSAGALPMTPLMTTLKVALSARSSSFFRNGFKVFAVILVRIDPVHADLHVRKPGAVEGVDEGWRQTPSVRDHHTPLEAQPPHLSHEVR